MKLRLVFAYLMTLLLLTQVAYAESSMGGFSGRWLSPQKQPMAGGLVLVFNEAFGPPPLPEQYWRVPDVMAPIDQEGRFTVDVPPGNYYVGLMQRSSTSTEIGPLLPGDFYFFNRDNQGNPKIFSLPVGEKKDLGTFVEVWTFAGNSAEKKGATGIGGIITDENGKALEGALVFAFQSPEMAGRPLFVSQKTGKDGRYYLGVSKGGVYYLKVRNNYGGGRPAAGQITGFYGNGKPAPIKVETGMVTKGITIKGERFVEPRETKEKSTWGPRINKQHKQ